MMVPKPELAMVLAYIDPGSGFLMLQMLGGAVLGAWFYFRRSVAKFTARVLGRRPPNLAQDPASDSATTAPDAH